VHGGLRLYETKSAALLGGDVLVRPIHAESFHFLPSLFPILLKFAVVHLTVLHSGVSISTILPSYFWVYLLIVSLASLETVKLDASLLGIDLLALALALLVLALMVLVLDRHYETRRRRHHFF
jgi:hypothetical protein